MHLSTKATKTEEPEGQRPRTNSIIERPPPVHQWADVPSMSPSKLYYLVTHLSGCFEPDKHAVDELQFRNNGYHPEILAEAITDKLIWSMRVDETKPSEFACPMDGEHEVELPVLVPLTEAMLQRNRLFVM